MAGFEPGSSGVRNSPSANSVATAAYSSRKAIPSIPNCDLIPVCGDQLLRVQNSDVHQENSRRHCPQIQVKNPPRRQHKVTPLLNFACGER